ncbi:MAG: hypothetical protein ACHP84_06485 [Caulobacterales bacterium]
MSEMWDEERAIRDLARQTAPKKDSPMPHRQYAVAKMGRAGQLAILIAAGLSLAGVANAVIDKDKDGSKKLLVASAAVHPAQGRHGVHRRRHGVNSNLGDGSVHSRR